MSMRPLTREATVPEMSAAAITSCKTRVKGLIGHSASRYVVIGGGAFAVDYAVLLGAYYIAGLPLAAAVTAGFLAGLVVSFNGNKRWVFEGEQEKRTGRQLAEYVALLVVNCLFTVWAVGFLNAHGFPPFIGKMLPIALITCWDYVLFRWAIFGEAKQSTPVPVTARAA